MNLKEEILKNQILDGGTPKVTTAIAIKIAEAYAKEHAIEFMIWYYRNEAVAKMHYDMFIRDKEENK